MSSVQERLQQLLDGELDPSEIADDPTLVSLADRLYGIKIAAVQPVKARDAQDLLGGAAPVTEVAPPTDMLVEVIGTVGAPAVAAPVPLPVPEVQLDLPPVPAGKKSPVRFVFLGGLLVVVLNLFGVFSSLFNSTCEPNVCRGPEQTRLNLMSPHLIGESDGWSYSLLSESMNGVGGVAGGIGIPDIVALVVLIGGFLWMRRK
ncbi:MAG: hypothetical protein VXY14_06175 [Candidatus Thermoplasmatota archaeon]|nr:hypothetical protein [Candidatus Thermoplasmatota archaeon]